MEPACMKMTLLVFLAVFAMRARSQTQHSIGPYTTSETERCVCQPHITVNPPVCGRSVPVNSGTGGYNCTTVQEILRTVSINQEDTTRKVDTVSSELTDTKRIVEELQANQETVSSELTGTKRIVEELQDTVSAVSSEVQGLRRQLEDLQVSVSTLIEFLHVRLVPPNDCSEILARGELISGVYPVQPLDSGEAFQVYCDMETDGGGWTVFQRRQDGSVDFYLDFANYSRGFGNLEGEFWLGNDNLHRLTAQGEYELRVDLTSLDDDTGFACYGSFSIADVSDNYTLTVGNYSGTAGDKLSHHNNQAFSTKDRDNDASSGNCAELGHGAWWYRSCTYSNLNGRYYNEASISAYGIRWRGFSGYRSLKTTEMKIRRKV
ncbi:ficolin-2-like [Asterias rubens]|uniref:ficolin-2-like n=1 Tax=Asterias rubens TaxID=7604 RepID=UPI001454ECF3|nr:ficolin-2-like [Asterias rubens]